MADRIRIPLRWLKQLVEDAEQTHKAHWTFESDGGNTLNAEIVTGPDGCEHEFKSVDFEYNPED
jgi:hypothetical protein